MTSQLHQIQITYDQVQDRLILNFNTQDFLEYRFWVTRRVLKGFWDILQQVDRGFPPQMKQKIKEQARPKEQVKQEIQIAEASKYTTRLTKRPLGDEPVILCKISATPAEGGFVLFRLEDFHGHSVEFPADAFLVSLIIQLIVKIMPKTDWNLPFG